jgi:predicted nucleic acid-binding protein
MEKALFFDAGPIISLVMSRLIWILPKLKEKYGGHFYITPAVKKELVERPSTIRRFEFEALQVMKLIRDGTLELYTKVPAKEVERLKNLANKSFRIRNKNMDIIQSGEMEAVACALETGADSVVMDERTLRLFMESNRDMEKLLEIRFKKDVIANTTLMDEFSSELKGIKVIRSIELVAAAFKLGLLKDYLPPGVGGRAKLLDSVLWAVKYNGCAVTEHEINEIKEMLL